MSNASTRLADLVGEIATTLQGGDPLGAAKRTAELLGIQETITELPKAYTVLNSLLHWLLNNNQYPLAARLLWSPNVFASEPYATKLVWGTIQHSSSYLLMGAASMSKSYSGGAWHLLDWVRDPEFTTIKLVGPSETHLEENLFSHMVRMHRESAIPLPGVVGKLFIGLDPRERRSSISAVIIPPGKKGGRLQGMKRFPRPGNAHPIFGRLSRMRIFLDEMEKIPPGVWKDVDNIFSNIDPDPEGFKIGGAFNPEDQNGPCGIRCEPINGWESIDRDADDTWKSRRGWNVCRLNAMKSENVIAGKKIYEGLQTKEGVDRIVENAGGWNAPGVYTMVYAMFPPKGLVHTVISQDMLSGIKGDFIWVGRATPCGGVDLALEGGDSAFFAAGRYGLASGYRLINGTAVDFKDADDRPVARPALQLDQLFPLPVAAAPEMAKAVRNMAATLGIKPTDLMVDRTGNGAGVHDVLLATWSPEVRGINYSEGASQTRILTEDTTTPYDDYERVWAELWFALKKWITADSIKISPFIETDQLFHELTSRQYESGGNRKKTQVESKKAYKDRNGGKSPDRADAFTLLLHACRMSSQYMPSLTGDPQLPDSPQDNDRAPAKVSCTDILDTLDD